MRKTVRVRIATSAALAILAFVMPGAYCATAASTFSRAAEIHRPGIIIETTANTGLTLSPAGIGWD